MKKYQKAVTFSYDDTPVYDKELIRILDAYGMKASFNMNSNRFLEDDLWEYKGTPVSCIPEADLKVYDRHEVCLHGTRHLFPDQIGKDQFEEEFLKDKEALEKRFGREVIGGAYAYGKYTEEVVEYLKGIGIQFMRGCADTFGTKVDSNENMMVYRPTCHHDEARLFDIIDDFFAAEEDRLLYIWGHSYEFAGNHNFSRIEEICKKLAGHSEVLYGTNTEVFRNFGLLK